MTRRLPTTPWYIAALAAWMVLTGCSFFPPPGDPTDPYQPYDCDQQPELRRGVVESDDPIENCYIGILLEPPVAALGVSPRAALEFVTPQGAEPLPLINGYVVRDVTRREARSLAAATRSASGSRVALFQCSRVEAVEPTVTPTGAVWGLDRIDQRELPLNGLYAPLATGAGVKIGINDTGEPFQFAGWRNVAPCLSAVGNCKDDHNHGSHVGGTAAHERFGVAPDAEIAWCKSLVNGSGSSADVIECIQKVTDWCTEGEPCIGNMSLGGSKDDPIDRAVCASREAGVLWVVAAGNESTDACTKSPARGTGAVTVGATDDRDTAASFTNHGGCVDIHAPGVRITSVGKRGERLTWDGTSMASPHVAGVAALCAETLDTHEPDALEQCLHDLATLGQLRGLKPGTPNSLVYTPSR